MKMLFTGLRAVVCGTGFVALWAWISLGFRAYDRYIPIVLPGWAEPLGIVQLSLGGILGLLCVGTLVLRGEGTPAPFDPPREFVASGPYRIVRNPMYIGGWVALMGFGFYQHSISILLFSLVWLFLIHMLVCYIEEPGLERRFGESYREYKRSVNRWIPRAH
jgi:protein-S-isoprenylcysteine O-methyltransferase Ste14